MLASDKILGLDIGAATVKVAEFQATKSHGLRLLSFNHATLGLDPEHEENRSDLIVSTVRNALRERSIRTKRVIFSVSGQSVFTRFVKLPMVDESKVVQIIQYEAQQNVPFPIDEVVWDYQLIGGNTQGEMDVVLLAIKSNIIEEMNDAVESAGLMTEMVDVAPMALSNAVRYNYGELDGCTAVLDIGARTTNLLFLEQNKIFSRSIPIAGNAITQSIATEFNLPFAKAEQMKQQWGFVALGGAYEEPENEDQARVSKIIRNVMTRLHAEVARSINFYRSQQGGNPPKRLLLSGGSSIIPYTDRFFQEKLQFGLEYFNPFRNVELAPQINREELAKCAHFFGEVVGLGLRKVTECPIEVNLLPKSLQARRQVTQKRPFLVAGAIALLMVPLCWWLFTAKTVSLKQNELAAITDQVKRLKDLNTQISKEQTGIKTLGAKADQATLLLEERDFWPALMQELNLMMVKDLWIISCTPLTAAQITGTPSAPTQPSRGGRGRGPEIEATPTTTTPKPQPQSAHGIVALDIAGGGRHIVADQDLRLVDRFAENLRHSPFFDPQGIELKELPSLMGGSDTFTFRIQARIAGQATK